ncbi:hypothetical protein N7508_000852 [Penicillium antarcticum]|uniref:uncharacterized protein n=1 Tax=Penicillium antarcticum TaxID=416450 RepID=UPI00238EFDDB|nr:uncharacterized protein N7508_000852 [Penicillium antarcticum]KAJ5320569.1 hypothetical protein N7508_000852 [Penicillium antarcticum]
MGRLQGHAILRRALPPLCIGENHTTSSAINIERYLGDLNSWKDFFDDVKAFEPEHEWSRRVLRLAHNSRPTDPELLLLAVGAVLNGQEVEIAFADFKAAEISNIYPGYSYVPDVALISTNTATFYHLKAIGELQTPWAYAYSLFRYLENKERLRKLLGQCIGYMLDLRVIDGFMSSYDETICLRQGLKGNEWVIEYSPNFESSPCGFY